MDDHDMDSPPASRARGRISPPSSRHARGRRAGGQGSSAARGSSSPHYAYSDDESGQGEMAVDDDIDELLSPDPRAADDRGDDRVDDRVDDDDDEEGGDTGKTEGQRECLWEGCNEMLEDQAELVKHVQEAHIGAGRQPYACLWATCSRLGQRQASRHALLTHMRSHTGEKPYACPEPGCGRTFTRSDAMNKHVKSIHAPGARPRRREEVVIDAEEPKTADRDLAKDDDLAEVIVRLRSRDRIHYKAENAEEEASVRYMRETRPGGAPARNRRGRKNAASDSDEFDEGAGKKYPNKRKVDGYLIDQGDNEVPLMSRSRWQAKYVMAKAKLMLVDEENKMRREELLYWEEEEKRMMAQLGLGSTFRPIQIPDSPEPEPHHREPRETRETRTERWSAAHRPPDSRRSRGGHSSPEPRRRTSGRRSAKHEPATLDDELYEAAMG
ncbi:uncharacterized protein CcaverHIS019_0702450 [Cutaneotrichosporon cavernicola]|uniref:C2H2-type domain-containing protein n=1 Tax=Cutaneotrichosporon cavernicola TaxID=279322 RepID=A0AA48QYG9_9TREE|nr:uncharacterized protein CcaverHIS019_0702450 [Cutaneotrichosporon cavernicola]BEI94664.1 hypothetical protein CcaverHIS019_0702450 [Cutaneotrichosporon cavernicola]BEJ02439.1 hypothetical protein CcaverHIS631_0702340 [Cutaneotrichosporon cavernicola]BEJ10198.1 hypothetical protein CcaverHIS641_0702330 [Cutaneotrichosporon cavernicola]